MSKASKERNKIREQCRSDFASEIRKLRETVIELRHTIDSMNAELAGVNAENEVLRERCQRADGTLSKVLVFSDLSKEEREYCMKQAKSAESLLTMSELFSKTLQRFPRIDISD